MPAEQTSMSIGPSSAVAARDGRVDVGGRARRRRSSASAPIRLPVGAARSNVATRRPFGEEARGRRGTDAARGAGDERDPAKESMIVCHRVRTL